MQQFSKYKIITVGFILMFIFAIAAIYTNTKDIVTQKAPLNKIPDQQQTNKLTDLTNRIDTLERKVYSFENNLGDTGVRCRIQGITNDGDFIPMPDQEAINQARENNKEIVITCMFN